MGPLGTPYKGKRSLLGNPPPFKRKLSFPFHTRLVLKSADRSLKNKVEIYPPRKDALAGMLQLAGFRRQEYYASYQGDR